MIKTSTGLAANMMVTGSFVSTMNLCKIKIFGGTVAADADAAETGTLLVTITNAGTATGLTWEAAAVGRAAVKTHGSVGAGVILTPNLSRNTILALMAMLEKSCE